MFRVSPQVFVCPTSALIAHKNSYGSAIERIKEQNSSSCTWYRPRPSETTNFRQRWVQNHRVAKAFLSVAILEISPAKCSLLGRSQVVKILLAFFGSFVSFPLHFTVNPSAPWKDLFSAYFHSLGHYIVSLIFVMHSTHGFLMCLIILVTCWNQKRNFSPCFTKARMPFITFQCDTVFSLYSLPS